MLYMKQVGFLERVKTVFSCDSRSLAFFRIGLGIVLILDLINRARDLTAHYTDYGVFPRDILNSHYTKYFISVYELSGEFWFVLLFFIISFIFATMLLLGYKTKLATIISWFLLISLQSRNPIVLQGGDILFRMLFFWAIFLPLNLCWSVDSSRKKRKGASLRVCNIGTIAVLLQVCFLYFFTGLLKNGKEWLPEGTAIYYALNIDQFTTHFGLFLLKFPLLLKFLTYFVIIYWFVGVLSLLIPFAFPYVRMIAILIFISLQSGMSLSLHLGLFPLIAIVAMFPLIPSEFWNFFNRQFFWQHWRKKFINREGNDFDFSNIWKIIMALVGAFFILYIFVWNLTTLGLFNMPSEVEAIGYLTRVDQKWDMFAPYPLKDDGWYVIPGALANGKQIDLFRGDEKINWEKPEFVAELYKNQRWRKYMMNIWQKRYSYAREPFADYLCREWNAEHFGSERLQKLEIVFMREDTLPDYQYSEPVKIILLEYECK